YELLPSFVAMRNAIREVDPNHVIVAEGNWWGSDLSKLDWEDGAVKSKSGISQKWDANLVYEIHHYGAVAGTMGREALTNRLNVPLILGEYGETDEANLAATTKWAKASLAGYFPWSFKKMSHDKALWTVMPNAAYDAVKAFIARGGAAPTQQYDAMISFAQNQVRNGAPGLVWHQGFYDGVKPN
ncbi:endoglucanase, partial [bacterium]